MGRKKVAAVAAAVTTTIFLTRKFSQPLSWVTCGVFFNAYFESFVF